MIFPGSDSTITGGLDPHANTYSNGNSDCNANRDPDGNANCDSNTEKQTDAQVAPDAKASLTAGPHNPRKPPKLLGKPHFECGGVIPTQAEAQRRLLHEALIDRLLL